MRIVFVIAFVTLLYLITGCSNIDSGQENEQQGNFADPIHYETNNEKQERLGSDDNPAKEYLQSNEKGIGRGGTEQNIFATDEAREIAQQLSSRDDVKQTQVGTTDDQVVVFVLLNDYQDPHIAQSLEQDIEKISPNKEIFVYTDKVHWNRLKDLDSSMKARDMGENLEKFLEDNFNIEIKD